MSNARLIHCEVENQRKKPLISSPRKNSTMKRLTLPVAPPFIHDKEAEKQQIASRADELNGKIRNSVQRGSAVCKGDAEALRHNAVTAPGEEAADPSECVKKREQRDEIIEERLSAQFISARIDIKNDQRTEQPALENEPV